MTGTEYKEQLQAFDLTFEVLASLLGVSSRCLHQRCRKPEMTSNEPELALIALRIKIEERRREVKNLRISEPCNGQETTAG